MGLCERWMRERDRALFVCLLCAVRFACALFIRGLVWLHVVRYVCFCASLFAWYIHLLITNNALAYLRVATYSRVSRNTTKM